jgi:hypothetical protein
MGSQSISTQDPNPRFNPCGSPNSPFALCFFLKTCIARFSLRRRGEQSGNKAKTHKAQKKHKEQKNKTNETIYDDEVSQSLSQRMQSN